MSGEVLLEKHQVAGHIYVEQQLELRKRKAVFLNTSLHRFASLRCAPGKGREETRFQFA